MDAKVYAVDKVAFYLSKSKPPQLIALADGRVPTSGWSHGRLSPYVYLVPPADGIWDFDFIATPPRGPSLQVITPISAEPFMSVLPPWCKGIRVHASFNSLESDASPLVLDADSLVTFPSLSRGGRGSSGDAVHAGDDLIPWPWKSFDWQVNPANSSIPKRAQSLTGSGADKLLCSELVGKALRVYHDGDMLTLDHRPDRCNIGLSKASGRIAEVWLG